MLKEEYMLYFETRDENLRFMKRLWNGEVTICPKCGKAELVLFHKKAKKSNCDWICSSCGERFDTIKILNELNER